MDKREVEKALQGIQDGFEKTPSSILKIKEMKRINKKKNELERTLEILTALDELNIDPRFPLGSWLYPEAPWRTEYRFDDKREWRFDYSHSGLMLAVEINGGVYVQGRHTRGEGFKGDMQKLNAAQLQGWTVLQYTPQMGKAMLRDVKIYIDQRRSHE